MFDRWCRSPPSPPAAGLSAAEMIDAARACARAENAACARKVAVMAVNSHPPHAPGFTCIWARLWAADAGDRRTPHRRDGLQRVRGGPPHPRQTPRRGLHRPADRDHTILACDAAPTDTRSPQSASNRKSKPFTAQCRPTVAFGAGLMHAPLAESMIDGGTVARNHTSGPRFRHPSRAAPPRVPWPRSSAAAT